MNPSIVILKPSFTRALACVISLLVGACTGMIGTDSGTDAMTGADTRPGADVAPGSDARTNADVRPGTDTGTGADSRPGTDSEPSADSGPDMDAAPVVDAGPITIQVSVSPSMASLAVGGTAQFTATVTGSTNTAVTWVASGGNISTTGLYTATGPGNYIVTATSVADPRAYGTAHANVTGGSTLSMPDPVRDQTISPAIYIRSPFQGMQFLAPATVTVIADTWDDAAPTAVDYMDGTMVAYHYTYVPNPSAGSADGYMLRGVLQNLATGTHELWVRETSADGTTNDSPHMTITVVDPPTYSGMMSLSGDLTLSGDVNWVGTASQPFLIQGNGHKIISPSNYSGNITIQNVQFRDLGADPSGQPTGMAIGLQVETTGNIDVEGSLFEHCGSIQFSADGNATVNFRGNTLNENTAVSVTNSSNFYGEDPFTPVVDFGGSSTAAKVFAGNRVAMGWVEFDFQTNWTIGGMTNEDTNFLMGPRGGVLMTGSANGQNNTLFQGNYSYNNCPNRWTQCTNFLFDNIGTGIIVEHSVLRGGWILRPFAGEARYNVLVAGGESFMQGWEAGASLHHNIINNLGLRAPGFDNNIFDLYDATATGIQIFNNTWDGGGAYGGMYNPAIRIRDGAVVHSIRSNSFVNFPYAIAPLLSGDMGQETQQAMQQVVDYVDYNQFYNPDRMTPAIQNYDLTTTTGAAPGSNGFGGHDLGGYNHEVDPRFVGESDSTAPEAMGEFPFADGDAWSGQATMLLMLQHFANYYRPDTGSPLTDSGDPQDGAGTDVGAVDTGTINSSYDRIDDFNP